MTTGHKITLGLAAALVVCCSLAIYGYLREHDARTKRDAQVQVLSQQADDLEKKNSEITAAATTQVAVLEKKKESVKTVSQAVEALPEVINLPEPAHEITKEDLESLPDSPVKVGDVLIPAASVKPLYDAQVTCKEDAVNLAACTQKLENDEAIIATKDKIIKADEEALKGGTKWQRFKTAGKWLAIGAAIGAAGITIAHH